MHRPCRSHSGSHKGKQSLPANQEVSMESIWESTCCSRHSSGRLVVPAWLVLPLEIQKDGQECVVRTARIRKGIGRCNVFEVLPQWISPSHECCQKREWIWWAFHLERNVMQVIETKIMRLRHSIVKNQGTIRITDRDNFGTKINQHLRSILGNITTAWNSAMWPLQSRFQLVFNGKLSN